MKCYRLLQRLWCKPLWSKIPFYPQMLTRCLTGGVGLRLFWLRFDLLKVPLPLLEMDTSHGELGKKIRLHIWWLQSTQIELFISFYFDTYFRVISIFFPLYRIQPMNSDPLGFHKVEYNYDMTFCTFSFRSIHVVVLIYLYLC